jgi:hypothetical protein
MHEHVNRQFYLMSAKAEFCTADARVPVGLNGSRTALSGGVNKGTTQMYQRGVKWSFLIPRHESRGASAVLTDH